jgi:hypothetical protein
MRKTNKPNAILLQTGGGGSGSDSSQGERRRRSKRFEADHDSDHARGPRSAPAKSFLSSDVWDMPATPSKGDTLTWQQTLMSASPQKRGHRKRDSAVDMTPDRPVTDPNLTWQQQLLASGGKTSPAKGRRARGKHASGSSGKESEESDSQLEAAMREVALEPFTIDDLFSSTAPASAPPPAKSAASPSKTPKKRPVAPRPATAPLQRSNSAGATSARALARDSPTTSMPSVPSSISATPHLRYAGPEFHNSPSASSLPMPSLFRGAVKAA